MTIRLPLTANELVDAALEQLDEEGQQVEEAMLGQILPRTIQVILNFDAKASETVRSYPGLRSAGAIEEISQTLWSYPGSSGAARIRNILQVHGLDASSASAMSQTILNYTRYPISIVNYMRHMQTSINAIRNIFYGPKAPDAVFQDLGYTKSQLSEWVASSNNLNTAVIDSEASFQNWLVEVENHLRTFLPMQGRINRALNGRENPTPAERPGLFNTAVARAYARRFGNYVAAHAKFKDAGKSAQGRGSTISDEFAQLLNVYEGTDKAVYTKLLSDFERRSSRLSASASKHVERPSRSTSLIQQRIEQTLNLNGKTVEIRTSSSNLPQALVDQFVKSLVLQYEMNPMQKKLSTRLNIGQDSIEVEIEKPERADLKKIQSFIETMYLG
jgi:hypothetical protein